jgi:hypothetical protein
LIDDNVKQNIVEVSLLPSLPSVLPQPEADSLYSHHMPEQTLCECLLDANREVCEVSATVLAAILRCSQRKMILTLKVSPSFLPLFLNASHTHDRFYLFTS